MTVPLGVGHRDATERRGYGFHVARSDGWSGSVLVTRCTDDILLETCAGLSDASAGVRCMPMTRFQAGSISKQFVTAAALSLVEQGQLDLHRPIGRWLPGADAVWAEITLHQLLSHTSGIGHWADVPGLDITSLPSPTDILRLVALAPLSHRPGKRWLYSGPGYLLAASIIEIVSGTAYGSFTTARLIDAAGMSASTSGHFPLDEPGVAHAYRAGEAVDVNPALSALPGTGDLWTTTTDLNRWVSALNERTLLTDASITAMRTNHAAIPAQITDSRGPIVAAGYGYGTRLGTILGHPAIYHSGDNPGYSSILAWLPDINVTIAILTNEEGRDLTTVLDEVVAPVIG